MVNIKPFEELLRALDGLSDTQHAEILRLPVSERMKVVAKECPSLRQLDPESLDLWNRFLPIKFSSLNGWCANEMISTVCFKRPLHKWPQAIADGYERIKSSGIFEEYIVWTGSLEIQAEQVLVARCGDTLWPLAAWGALTSPNDLRCWGEINNPDDDAVQFLCTIVASIITVLYFWWWLAQASGIQLAPPMQLGFPVIWLLGTLLCLPVSGVAGYFAALPFRYIRRCKHPVPVPMPIVE